MKTKDEAIDGVYDLCENIGGNLGIPEVKKYVAEVWDVGFDQGAEQWIKWLVKKGYKKDDKVIIMLQEIKK